MKNDDRNKSDKSKGTQRKKPEAAIDRNQAKPQDGAYLTGQLLLAMPSMGDPRFEKAAIFICAHDEKGAMGFVINHVMPGVSFEGLLDQLGITSDIHLSEQCANAPVMSGGPVDTARGFLLHSPDFAKDDTIRIDCDFSVTGTVEALRAIAQGQGPEEFIFALGYAGWGAGQLEKEIQQNAWLTSAPSRDIIFTGQPDDIWRRTLSRAGIDLALLSTQAGRA